MPINVTLVMGHIELRPHFAGRAFGNRKKLHKLSGASSFKTLGNIGHDGDCGAPNLVTQSKIPRKPTIIRDRVNTLTERPSLLPSLDFFYLLEGSHSANSKLETRNSKLVLVLQLVADAHRLVNCGLAGRGHDRGVVA